MFDIYTLLQGIFLIVGILLLLFGLRFFKLFLYTAGVLLSFMASDFIHPFLKMIYPSFSSENYAFFLLALGLIIGFLFLKTYTMSIYFACVLVIFFILQYHAQIFNMYHFQNIFILSVVLGTFLNYFFKRSITILLTAALGAIFFTTSLSLIWKLQETGLDWQSLQDNAQYLLQNGIGLDALYKYIFSFRSVNFFSQVPLALTFLSCLIQNFVTCKKAKV